MFCKQCGAKLDDDARFCTYCGATVEGGSPTGPAPGPVPNNMAPENNMQQENPGNGPVWDNPVPQMQNRRPSGDSATKKALLIPFIIIGVIVLIIIIFVVAVNVISAIRAKQMEEKYYDFYTKDEFNQMMDDMENEEKNRKKGIGEHMAEDFIESVYGDEEGTDGSKESDDELDEKLKNSASPWFKDPEDLYGDGETKQD